MNRYTGPSTILDSIGTIANNYMLKKENTRNYYQDVKSVSRFVSDIKCCILLSPFLWKIAFYLTRVESILISCAKMQIHARPLTGDTNFDRFSVKDEEMVDLLFEAMTHGAVKPSLINGHATLQCTYVCNVYMYVHIHNVSVY